MEHPILRPVRDPDLQATRTECLSTDEITEPTNTRHDVHLCRKLARHTGEHRCWACVHVWSV